MDAKKWLIVGIGADFRGDDSFGLDVIDYLATCPPRPSISLKKCNDISKLCYYFHPDLNLVLVDAVKDHGRDLGSEFYWQISGGELPRETGLTSSHSIGLADSLAMAQIVGNLPRKIKFFGVVGKKFGLGDSASSEVLAKIECIGIQILARIEEIKRQDK